MLEVVGRKRMPESPLKTHHQESHSLVLVCEYAMLKAKVVELPLRS